MKIKDKLAQEIVTSLKEIIDRNLNFMDVDGTIVASTDKDRIGDFHEAAVLCAKQDRIIVIEHDKHYKGAKKGINIPVKFDNKVVAVIGITGERHEVEKFGNIIRKMTEILITENWIKENKIKKRDSYRNFLEALITENSIIESSLLGVSPLDEKYIVVARDFSQNQISPDISEKMYNIISLNKTGGKERIYSFFYNEVVLLYQKISKQTLIENIKIISKEMKGRLGLNLSFGISRNFFDLSDFKEEYQNAKSALTWLLNTPKKDNMSFYEDMDLGILLSNIKDTDKKRFTNMILSNLSDEEICSYKELLNSYAKNNGSIQATADELFIHKNTLQYRLNKLNSLTGYNPRDYNDFLILKLAFILI